MEHPPGPDAPEVGTTYTLTDEEGDDFDVYVVAWDPVRRIGTGACFPHDPIFGNNAEDSYIVAFAVNPDGTWTPNTWTRRVDADE
jgi:hypothetical protein